MTSTRALVSVVDDNESVRESLPDLLQYSGFDVQAFSSAEAFLESQAVSETRCLILDVGLPGMSGPDLQQELHGADRHPDHVHHRARRQIAPSAADRARRGGVLFKPFSDTALLDAVNAALGDEVRMTNDVDRAPLTRGRVYCEPFDRSRSD